MANWYTAGELAWPRISGPNMAGKVPGKSALEPGPQILIAPTEHVMLRIDFAISWPSFPGPRS